MTAQFVHINNTIINLEAISDAYFYPETTELRIHFNSRDASALLVGEDALVFWKCLKCSALNITPQPKLTPRFDLANMPDAT